MSGPDITDLGLSMGKKGRLRRILHQSGLRNGTALLLPYGVDLSRAPQRSAAGQAGDPTDAIRLAFEGDFNGIVLPVELAEKFYADYAGELPLIVMLNGYSDGPGAAAADGTVADAVRLGADAVGYLLYADGPPRTPDSRSTGGSRRTLSTTACPCSCGYIRAVRGVRRRAAVRSRATLLTRPAPPGPWAPT